MCLVNNAVYIAKYATAEKCQLAYGYVPGDIRKHPGEWNATGTQFQIPYVFKKLFSREEIVFEDMCETKSVTTALYLDTNETLPDVSEYGNIIVELTMEEVVALFSGATLGDPNFNEYGIFIRLEGSTPV